MARQRRAGNDESPRVSKTKRAPRRNRTQESASPWSQADAPHKAPEKKVFKPKTERQRILVSTIKSNDITFATGVAGSGKSHCCIETGVQLYEAGLIKYFYFTKPDFEIDEKIGILPGGVDEKQSLRMKPIQQLLIKRLGQGKFDYLVRMKVIVFEPLGSILGLNFDDAFIMVDEAQNTTPGQMKAILTRTGENSKVVVCGDYREQVYIPGRNGLEDALKRLAPYPGIGHVDFTLDDCVRSGICRTVIEAYRQQV